MSEQSETAGTPNNAESGDSAMGGLDALGALLEETEPKEPGGDEGEESGGSQKTAPTKFNDLAGAVDMDLDALYKLEIGIEGAEEPVTIEHLKDQFKKSHDFDLQVIEFEERRTEEINELVRAKTELNEILQSLPANAVKPEVLERIRNKAAETAETERAKTLGAIPEWKDDQVRAADLTAMTEHMQGYGFPVNQLQQMVDHRWQRYIRDNMLRERRVKEALAKVRAAKPPKSGNAPPQKKGANKGQTVIKQQAGQSKLEATLSNIE